MPRQKSSQFMDKYAKLPDVFTFDDIKQYYKNAQTTRTVICLLVSKGIIEKVGNRKWKKCVSDIQFISTTKEKT